MATAQTTVTRLDLSHADPLAKLGCMLMPPRLRTSLWRCRIGAILVIIFVAVLVYAYWYWINKIKKAQSQSSP